MQFISQITRIVFLTSAIFIYSCGGKNNNKAGEKATPVTVTISTPSGDVSAGINISGKIEAVQTANISTRLMGNITRIYVNVGDKVHKGQLLASISVQDIAAKKAQTNAAITEAEANVKNAQKDFERFTNLYNKNSASAKELDNITLQYNAAKAKLDAATQMRNEVNAMMAYANLTAPFDGVVTQKMTDEGSMANPGMPLLTVEQNGQLQVSATVSESDITRLKKGNKAQAEIKAIGKTIECIISEISPSSQLTGGQYMVKLKIPENQKKDLYSGMYVNAFIPTVQNETAGNNENTILIPASSIVNADQLTGLYTISSNNTALLRWIRTGKKFGDKIEVLSGLGAGERFIVSAEGKLYNGVPVAEKK